MRSLALNTVNWFQSFELQRNTRSSSQLYIFYFAPPNKENILKGLPKYIVIDIMFYKINIIKLFTF